MRLRIGLLALLTAALSWGQATVINGSTVTQTGFEILANKGAASGYAGLDGSSRLATTVFPAFTGDMHTTAGGVTSVVLALNGTTVPVNSAADQFLGTTGSAVGAWASIGNCLDSAGQHLNYATATHTFSCGTTASVAGTVTSVSGTTNQVDSTGGATPVLSLDSAIILPGTERHKLTTVTYGATANVDLSLSDDFQITLTGNWAPTFTNHSAGRWVTLTVIQDGTGNHSVTWPADVLGVADTGRTLSKRSLFFCRDDGTNLTCLIPNFNM